LQGFFATRSVPSEPDQGDLLAEYHFDYRRAKPNQLRWRVWLQKEVSVTLDEDVAEVFTTPESVNKALRALIEVVPQAKRLKRR